MSKKSSEMSLFRQEVMAIFFHGNDEMDNTYLEADGESSRSQTSTIRSEQHYHATALTETHTHVENFRGVAE